jgi:hypothetical protein
MSEAGTLRVAVVICTRDRPAQLETALAAAVAHARSSDDLIVVDSASTQPAVGQVAAAAGARVVRVDAPGLSRARRRVH